VRAVDYPDMGYSEVTSAEVIDVLIAGRPIRDCAIYCCRSFAGLPDKRFPGPATTPRQASGRAASRQLL
jgi:hypothetical protein